VSEGYHPRTTAERLCKWAKQREQQQALLPPKPIALHVLIGAQDSRLGKPSYLARYNNSMKSLLFGDCWWILSEEGANMNMPYFSLSINFAHESWGQQPQLRNDRCYSADARTVSNAGCQYGFFIHLAPVL